MKKSTLFFGMLLVAISVSAKTWTVNPAGGDGIDFTSIHVAVSSAEVADGDILQVSGEFEISEAISLTKALTIQGEGPASTVIKTTGINRAFLSYDYGKNFTLSGVTLEASGTKSNEPGVALFVYNVDDFTLENVRFKNFTTTSNGGALLINTVRKFAVKNCEFVNNTADAVGGAVFITSVGGQGLFENCTFERNSAPVNGWGNAVIFDNGSAPLDDVMFRNCTFYRNGTGLGGVIAINYANITISVHSCTFASNEGNDNVGDLYYIPNAGTPGLLSYKANLFYNSRGIVLPNEYAGEIDVRYNASSGPISIQEGTSGYDAFTNLQNLALGTELQVELDNSYPALKENGGKVRTIKLEGTEDNNYAIAFVGERISETDARGYTRKADYQDCGAYETNASVNLPTIKEKGVGIYPNPAKNRIHFASPLTGEIRIYDILGSKKIAQKVNYAGHLDVSSLHKGVYVIVIQENGQSSLASKLVIE